jgi:very-short-patch-repair endonuclease
MRGFLDTGRLHDLAERQHGVVTRWQLLQGGLGADAIDWRLRTGRLHRIHRGVYALGRRGLSRRGEWLAAVWACGDGAVLSHWSAAALHGTAAEPDEVVHVSVPHRVAGRSGVAVHHTRHLDPADVMTFGLLPVTRRPRTLVDLADLVSYAELRGIADGLRRLDLPALRAAQERAPNRRGAARVARLIGSDRRRTRSEFERRYLRFCTARGLPRPDATNVRKAGHEVDALYAGARLAVELDGRAHHERRAQMRADRRRDADLQLAGLRVLRLVWEQLDPEEAAATARLVRGLLALSS